MKLTFLGSGSAFTVGGGNWQSNMLLTADSGRTLLIDCGSDIRFSLSEVGLKARNIDAIYISHLHADHVGGMEWMGFSTFFDPSCPPPKLFVAPEVLSGLWEHTLRGGMNSVEGRTLSLTDYFAPQPWLKGNQFEWEGVEFTAVQARHVDDGERLMPCYGLSFKLNGREIFITNDTQFAPDLYRQEFANADLIFHDCETSPFKSTVHAHYDELRSLPLDIKGKTWLYHYQTGLLPDARKDGFLGFVGKGQVFE